MLNSIQKEIESIYRINSPFLVNDFLLGENERSHYLQQIPWLSSSEETLLVREKEGNLDIGLFFDPELLDWSKDFHWREIKSSQNPLCLEKLGALIEGVSHFVYFIWKAEQNFTLTQLELELQAEVDKFILFSQVVDPKHLESLIDSLYEGVEWIPSLTSLEKSRYEIAAKLAFQYCHHLKKTYFHSDRAHAIYAEIRNFYRMSQTEKIRWIQS